MIRRAGADDIATIVRLVNAAFVVENFFKIGDRTDEREIRDMMSRGEFLILEDPPGTPVGTIYFSVENGRGYFGTLSVDPERQGRGYARRLIDEVEARCREQGCTAIDIHIVNLREELPPFYGRFGYVESGTLPFSKPDRASRPCHFIVMTKRLAG